MTTDHSYNSNGMKLPITFDVQQSLSNHHVISITVLQQIPNLNFNELHVTFSNQRVFKVQNEVHKILSSFPANYFLAKSRHLGSSENSETSLIYSIFNEIYGIINLERSTRIESIRSEHMRLIPRCTDITEFLNNIANKLISQESRPEHEVMFKTFSMKPPGTGIDIRKEKNILFSPQSSEDPLTFLSSRYFSTLYSLSSPLSYFPKTALSRLRNLCDNNPEMISQVIIKVTLPVEDMDMRHSNKYGLLMKLKEMFDNDSRSFNIHLEKENQERFLDRHEGLFNNLLSSDDDNPTAIAQNREQEEKVDNLLLDLKVREAHLQFILLLELLCATNVEESNFLTENSQLQEEELKRISQRARQSLIRRKSKKGSKKIIPTFLGMGIDVSEKPQAKKERQTSIYDSYTMYSSLNTLIDRMGLWDTLLMSNKNLKDQSIDFLAYVVIPYFKKRLPLIVGYITDKMKGLNLKLLHRNSKLKSLEPSEGSDRQKITKVTNSAHSKYKKTLLRRRNTLKASSSVLESDGLLPALTFKRSKSNLSSKNLQKRQVEMSLSWKQHSISEEGKKNENTDNEKRSKDSIFSNTKKIQESLNVQSFAEVFETPLKKQKFSKGSITQVDMTPNKKTESHSKSKSSFSQVEMTPSNRTHLRSNIISFKRTPNKDRINHSTSSSNPFITDMDDPALYSSPAESQITSSPTNFTKRHGIQLLEDSQLTSMHSPKKKYRPGDPIPIQSSPYYKSREIEKPENLFSGFLSEVEKDVHTSGNELQRISSSALSTSVQCSEDEVQSDGYNTEETDKD
ncbi:uncharacterized protein PRCAT00002797001 [Priceomyces carsonii]|uniref:uncharacterized protein n=1 Tax=Priceomyces carsonii TaxID=28549 RepID=UPI002EDA4F90|nr:unnamed protein product [Priceomyces carsonii]